MVVVVVGVAIGVGVGRWSVGGGVFGIGAAAIGAAGASVARSPVVGCASAICGPNAAAMNTARVSVTGRDVSPSPSISVSRLRQERINSSPNSESARRAQHATEYAPKETNAQKDREPSKSVVVATAMAKG